MNESINWQHLQENVTVRNNYGDAVTEWGAPLCAPAIGVRMEITRHAHNCQPGYAIWDNRLYRDQ